MSTELSDPTAMMDTAKLKEETVTGAIANPSSDTRPTVAPKRRRPKVKHYYDVADAEAALAMGINEVRTLCKRRWMKIGARREPITVRMMDGGQAVITNAKARDCLLCIRALRADTERSWRGHR